MNFMKFAIKAEELQSEIENEIKNHIQQHGYIEFPEHDTKEKKSYQMFQSSQCYLRKIYLSSNKKDLLIKYDDRKRMVFDIEDTIGIFSIEDLIDIMEKAEK